MSEQEKDPGGEEKKGTARREFLRKGGKVLAYSVPVIYSLQSTRLRAQEMSAGSVTGSVPDVPANKVTTLKDLQDK